MLRHSATWHAISPGQPTVITHHGTDGKEVSALPKAAMPVILTIVVAVVVNLLPGVPQPVVALAALAPFAAIKIDLALRDR